MPHGSPRIRLADGRMNLIGARVKERRLAADVTQDHLCGTLARLTEGAWIPTRHDVYRIEAGTRTVSDAEAVALAAALDCSLVWLVCGAEAELPPGKLAARIFRDARPAGQTTDGKAE